MEQVSSKIARSNSDIISRTGRYLVPKISTLAPAHYLKIDVYVHDQVNYNYILLFLDSPKFGKCYEVFELGRY